MAKIRVPNGLNLCATEQWHCITHRKRSACMCDLFLVGLVDQYTLVAQYTSVHILFLYLVLCHWYNFVYTFLIIWLLLIDSELQDISQSLTTLYSEAANA